MNESSEKVRQSVPARLVGGGVRFDRKVFSPAVPALL